MNSVRGSRPKKIDDRTYDALTDLSAFALRLEAERFRLDERLQELAGADSQVTTRRRLMAERDEIAEEVVAVRGTIAALGEQVRAR